MSQDDSQLPRLLTIGDVASLLRYSARQILRMEQSGALPARRQIGPRRRAWLSTDLATWMRELPTRAGRRSDQS